MKCVGIWDIATSSQVTVNRLTTSMETFFAIFGDLRGIDYILEMFPVKVSPEGQTQTIYAIDLSIVDKSQAEIREAGLLGPAPVAGVLPPPALEQPDALLHTAVRAAIEAAPEDADAGREPAAAALPTGEGRHRVSAGESPARPTGAQQVEAAASPEPLALVVERQMDAFTPHQTQVVLDYCHAHDIKPTRDGFIEQWGERARDIAECIGAKS